MLLSNSEFLCNAGLQLYLYNNDLCLQADVMCQILTAQLDVVVVFTSEKITSGYRSIED